MTTEQLSQRAPLLRWALVGSNHTRWYAEESRVRSSRPSSALTLGSHFSAITRNSCWSVAVFQCSRSGSVTTPATCAVWDFPQGTTVDRSDLAFAWWRVMVLQAPTVGAPRSGPLAWAWAGESMASVVTVRAAAAARARVLPEIVICPPRRARVESDRAR